MDADLRPARRRCSEPDYHSTQAAAEGGGWRPAMAGPEPPCILILRLPPRRCPPPALPPAPRSPQPSRPCPAARLMPATPHPNRLQIDPPRPPRSALCLPSRGPSSAGSSHWKGRRWKAKAAPPLTPCSHRFNHLQRAWRTSGPTRGTSAHLAGEGLRGKRQTRGWRGWAWTRGGRTAARRRLCALRSLPPGPGRLCAPGTWRGRLECKLRKLTSKSWLSFGSPPRAWRARPTRI